MKRVVSLLLMFLIAFMLWVILGGFNPQSSDTELFNDGKVSFFLTYSNSVEYVTIRNLTSEQLKIVVSLNGVGYLEENMYPYHEYDLFQTRNKHNKTVSFILYRYSAPLGTGNQQYTIIGFGQFIIP